MGSAHPHSPLLRASFTFRSELPGGLSSASGYPGLLCLSVQTSLSDSLFVILCFPPVAGLLTFSPSASVARFKLR